MRFWLNAGFLELDHLVPLARAAEEAGYEGIVLPDHLVFPASYSSRYPYSADGEVSWPAGSVWPDCWVAIAAMAQATERLRFGTGVFVAPLRDPFSLAKSIGTASVISAGRVACGFGAGWLREEFEAVGVEFESRGRRLDEMIEVLRLLWTGEMVEFHGEVFVVPAVALSPSSELPARLEAIARVATAYL